MNNRFTAGTFGKGKKIHYVRIGYDGWAYTLCNLTWGIRRDVGPFKEQEAPVDCRNCLKLQRINEASSSKDEKE